MPICSALRAVLVHGQHGQFGQPLGEHARCSLSPFSSSALVVTWVLHPRHATAFSRRPLRLVEPLLDRCLVQLDGGLGVRTTFQMTGVSYEEGWRIVVPDVLR